MEDLELIPTKKLISELCRRKTFAGAIIVSKDEHRKNGQIHNDFRVFSPIPKDGMIYVLERLTEYYRSKLNP